ncbi:MAG: methyltransferase domain-containing protein [Desulfobacterales bacterium]|nr:methyltransferase domain-containing protein [Desulfobacterales bacterium]
MWEAKDGISAEELAFRLGLHEPYLKIWCQTAYCFEILDCDDQERYKFQPYFGEVLGDESSLNYRGGAVNIAVNVTGQRLIESLDYYRSGKINESYPQQRSEIVSDSTRVLNRHIGFYLSAMLPQDDPIRQKMNSGAQFIDIGCGCGELVMHLAQLFKNSSFVGVDPVSYSIEAGSKKIQEAGLEGRVSLEKMGGEEITYEEEFDIASMVVTFHEIPPDIRSSVLDNAYKSLKKEGKLLLVDFSYPESLNDFRNPAFEPGVIDQFDETSLGIIHLSARQQDEMLTKTGFKDIQRISVQGMDILNATK